MKTIFNHRSIRKYKSKPIEENTLNKILEAGTRASTTGTMQVYSMVVTQDETIKNKLWEVHFKQEMVKQAPVVITFCADFNRFNKWCRQRKAEPGYNNFLSFYTASIDALLASQNVALEAEHHSLGICYLGTTTYMADKIIDILNLPEHVVPVTTIVLGHPDENPGLTERLPLNAVVHKDKYTDYTEHDIDHLYEELEQMDKSKQFIKENNKQTLAQVFTDVRYKKPDNIHFSKAFLEAIKKQGFMNHEE